jgi:hypothetical protein
MLSILARPAASISKAKRGGVGNVGARSCLHVPALNGPSPCERVASAAEHGQVPRGVVGVVVVDVVDLERDALGSASGASMPVGGEDVAADLLPSPSPEASR